MRDLQRVQQSLCDLFTDGYKNKADIIYLYLISALQIKGLSARSTGRLLQMPQILPTRGMSTLTTVTIMRTIRQIQIMFVVFVLRSKGVNSEELIVKSEKLNMMSYCHIFKKDGDFMLGFIYKFLDERLKIMESILRKKSYTFALRVVKLYKYLSHEKKEFVLSKQVLRSGTAVGALVYEAEFAQSKADFINKLSISLKEANETSYWLSLLKDSQYLDLKMYQSIKPDIEELIKILVSSIKTTKKNNKKGDQNDQNK